MSASRAASDWRPRIEAVVSELSRGKSVMKPVQDEHSLEQLAQFLDILARWNQKMDLTAARTPDELVDLFVADAVLLATASPVKRARWVDVGSGAGAPAIALSILRPDLALTLVEPKQKRVAFLRSAVGELGLKNVSVRRARSSDLESGAFDVACSRATLKPAEWLPEGARLADSVWVLLARESPPKLRGWRTVESHDYEWPLTHARRRSLRYVTE